MPIKKENKTTKAGKKKEKAVKPDKKEEKAVKPKKQKIITIRSRSDILSKTHIKIVNQHNDYINKLVNDIKIENEVDPSKSIRFGWNY